MNDSDSKVCPYCKERIRKEAVKCHYCGEWLNSAPSASTESQSNESAKASQAKPGGYQSLKAYAIACLIIAGSYCFYFITNVLMGRSQPTIAQVIVTVVFLGIGVAILMRRKIAVPLSYVGAFVFPLLALTRGVVSAIDILAYLLILGVIPYIRSLRAQLK